MSFGRAPDPEPVIDPAGDFVPADYPDDDVDPYDGEDP